MYELAFGRKDTLPFFLRETMTAHKADQMIAGLHFSSDEAAGMGERTLVG